LYLVFKYDLAILDLNGFSRVLLLCIYSDGKIVLILMLGSSFGFFYVGMKLDDVVDGILILKITFI